MVMHRVVTLVAASFVTSGCQTTAGEFVVRKMADAVNHYCGANAATRTAVRTNIEPYLADGTDIKVTCPGDE